MSTTQDTLLELSHFLGEEKRQLAILGEGNTSARIDEHTFLVKASGSCLQTLTSEDLVACRFDSLLPMLDQDTMSDQVIEDLLLASRVDVSAKKPSVETLFHAYLLSLEGVHFVGHTHSIAVNQILCSPRASQFATRKLFPDEIVCCGARSVLIPYTDPGLSLSKSIRLATDTYLDELWLCPSCDSARKSWPYHSWQDLGGCESSDADGSQGCRNLCGSSRFGRAYFYER